MNGLVEQLQHAELTRTPLAPMASPDSPALSAAQGYQLQREGLAQRVERGERLLGWKVAFASRAAFERFGLSEPVYGALTDAMEIEADAGLALSRFIQPKLEIELALRLGRDLSAGCHSDDDLLSAVQSMALAYEVADCRWQGWRFDAGAFLADNAAAAGWCLGPWQVFDARRAEQLSYVLYGDSALLGQGRLGTREDPPLVNLRWLLRRLLADGHTLRRGQVILSGALLAPLDMTAREYRFEALGTTLLLKVLPA
ncbi:2-keto-4-pentenoate hydratase [Pseudomonas sp. RP23018S]|uniref:2-keto-4-pentenoate hydratase n=1 Tax=Pseudomonas sp. RP23018S TaxID=3096037 RepID=UPI002ACA06E0|nr:2-keto-4-pentenoate hydratase [Pseudomonas sp. RP23018S]MDZ5602835.1 2-keto-4-pentenoate hydratase [Pseudomonas sp. RP23018S]